MPSASSSPALTKSAHTSRPLLRAVAEIWTTAAFLRDEMQDDTRSAALRWAAGTVEEAMRADGEGLLTVREAAAVSGASVGTVRRAVASGALENAGERYRPRVRRGDLSLWSPPRGRQGPHSDAADASEDRPLGGSRGHSLEHQAIRSAGSPDTTE